MSTSIANLGRYAIFTEMLSVQMLNTPDCAIMFRSLFAQKRETTNQKQPAANVAFSDMVFTEK